MKEKYIFIFISKFYTVVNHMRCYIYNTFSTDADSARTLLNPLFRCTFLKYPLQLSLKEKYIVPAAAVITNVKDALFMVRHLQENIFFEVNKTELRFYCG